MNKIKEHLDLVDIILDGSYTQYKKLNDVDTILDEVENAIDHNPNQDMDQLVDDVEDEMSKDSNQRQEEQDEEVAASMETPIPMENTELKTEDKMKNAIQLLVKEETYREFFKSMLDKWNIKSPSDLDDEKKKEFFDVVDREWKAKKETD
jgi:hypothetical protein